MPAQVALANAARCYNQGMDHDIPQDETRQPASTPVERLIAGFDNALRTLATASPQAARPSPAGNTDEARLSDKERKHAAGLMRINHAGEVAAQGLYQGHALLSRASEVHDHLQHAPDEEYDHLAWCRARLDAFDPPLPSTSPGRRMPMWLSLSRPDAG